MCIRDRLGPEAAIALVRDQNPVRVSKVRYYEDRVLGTLYEGQKNVGLGQEPREMPKAGLPSGDTERETTSRTEVVDRGDPQAAAENDAVSKTRAADTPVMKLGIVRGAG